MRKSKCCRAFAAVKFAEMRRLGSADFPNGHAQLMLGEKHPGKESMMSSDMDAGFYRENSYLLVPDVLGRPN